MGNRNAAVAAVFFQDGVNTVKFAVLFFSFQQVIHAFNEVVDVEQFQFRAAVVDGIGLVIGYSPAEGTDGAVVLGAAVAHEVREAVYCHFSSGFFSIGKEEFFSCFLALSVFAVSKASGKGGLDGGGKHNGTGVVIFL